MSAVHPTDRMGATDAVFWLLDTVRRPRPPSVPGPRRTCYWAGEAVERFYPFAPPVGDHPLSVALFSHRDTVCAGIDVDPLAMPDLPRFVDAFDEARRELLAVAGTGAVAERRTA